LKYFVVMAVAGPAGAWADTEAELRCGVNLGSSDLKHRESDGADSATNGYSSYERSLAGPRLEKVQGLITVENFKTPATERLLPELLTLANIGCIFRF
jgi:hypothetical protein